MPHRKPCSSSRKMVQFALNGSLSEGYLGTEYFITVIVMNYDGFNRPTFEIVRVWRNP